MALDRVIQYLKEHRGPQLVTSVEKHLQLLFTDALVVEIERCQLLSYDGKLVSYMVLAKLDTVISFLQEHRGPHSIATVKQETKIEIESFREEIERCPKITFDPGEQSLVYQPKYNLMNQAGLLQFLKDQREGVPLTDLVDAYAGADIDLEDLVAKNDVVSVYNPDLRDFVFFFRDKSEDMQAAVDDKTRQLWSEIVMPNNKNELDRKLVSLGHLSRADLAQRVNPGVVASKKQRRPTEPKRRRVVLTNTHMLDSMPWLKSASLTPR